MFSLKSTPKKVGDLKTMDEICASTWEPLYRYIYFKVQNREEAEDILQETYVKAFSHSKKTGLKPEKYLAFLKTIALNIVRDRWRRNKRRGIKNDLDSVNPINIVVDDHAEASTQRIWIENALSKLNSEQRMVIELRIIKGFSVAETAKMMNKKESTVRVLQYRSLQLLASLLEKSNK
jgi:RNA polymerase sigma-70 factor (ECF subfamily)